jgi:hypothetical protein
LVDYVKAYDLLNPMALPPFRQPLKAGRDLVSRLPGRKSGTVRLLSAVALNPNRIALLALVLGAGSPDCLARHGTTHNQHYGHQYAD